MFPSKKAPSKEGAFRFRSTDGRSLQSHCTAKDPSRQHPCMSVSIVSDILPGEQVVNR